ncbi:hypothetical protein [Arthrobacter sp. MDT1-65]
MASSDPARKTLVAGIVLGVVGLAGMLLTGQLVEGLNDTGMPNGGFYFLVNAISAILSFCLPFSAALIASSLVMRHAERLAGRDRQDEEVDEGAGGTR